MASPKKHSSRPPKRRGRPAREADPVAAPRDSAGLGALVYEVEVRDEKVLGYKMLCGNGNGPKRGACHDFLLGQSQMCADCPALELSKVANPRRQGAVIGTTSTGYRVAVAESLGNGRYRVAQLHLPEHLVTELQRARIDRMARRAKLSRRETSVLDLVLLGRTSAEVASALGITERTARFHVGNIFAKLQADSRSDLLRLLL